MNGGGQEEAKKGVKGIWGDRHNYKRINPGEVKNLPKMRCLIVNLHN